MTAILMPQIGQDIAIGRIVTWHKNEGEPVAKGEVVLTVESEKASFEVEAEVEGVLLKILCRENEEARVLSPVGYLGRPGESWRGEQEQVPGGGRIFASPSARRLARERAVDLGALRGSGPGGRIVKADVLASAGAAQDTIIPFNRVQRIAAERLTRASRDIPHFYLFQEVDMEAALAFREERNRQASVGQKTIHLTVTDLLLWAAVRALPSFPRLNAHVEEDRLIQKSRVNLGIAVATERGLLVPVVREAERLDLDELASEARSVVEEARGGRLDLDAAGTFTVSSLGMFGVPAFLPLINPPECAILGVGAVEMKAVARDGLIGARRQLALALACDHRAVDGAYAAGFLQRIKEILEKP